MEAFNIIKDIRHDGMATIQNKDRFIRHEWDEWAYKLKNSGDSQLESIGSGLLVHISGKPEREVM